MDEHQVAAYLAMGLRKVLKLASRGKIPCRKVGERKYRFRKCEVDHWVWEQMHNFDRKELAEIEILTGLGEARCGSVEPVFVDVTQGHDVLAGAGHHVGMTSTPGADDRDVQPVVGRLPPGQRPAG